MISKIAVKNDKITSWAPNCERVTIMSITETTIFDEFERTGLISDLKCIYLGRWNVFYTHIDHTYQVGRPGDTKKAPNWHSDNIVAMCNPGRGYLSDGTSTGPVL